MRKPEFAFDTSAIIYGWDNYPPKMFPTVWEWLAESIGKGNIIMLEVALEETSHLSPDCTNWLNNSGITKSKVDNEIIQSANSIKESLQIKNDNFNSRGVGANDILIIAHAKVNGLGLISQESKQLTPPVTKANYKIPLVCEDHSVDCLNFLTFLKQTGESF